MKSAVTFMTVIAFALLSCEQKDKHGKTPDTPTTGSITIVADESLRPIVETEVETFNSLHTKAHITALYMPEADAISAMLNEDTIRVAIVTRRLTADERKGLMEEVHVRAREEELATSGVAVIVNPQNTESIITLVEIQKLLKGEIKTWKDLGGKSNEKIEVVFDNANSSVIRQMKDSVARVDKLPENCFAVKNNEAVVDYVSKTPNALGLIGLEWISDSDAETTNTFLDKVKVMSVVGDSTDFLPYQAYLALKYYPIRRNIIAINREGKTGLGTGFVAFFASERGQRIILKSGLVPKTMPVRIVQFSPKGLKIEK